jgi:hypothetical protein
VPGISIILAGNLQYSALFNLPLPGLSVNMDEERSANLKQVDGLLNTTTQYTAGLYSVQIDQIPDDWTKYAG